MIRELSVFFPCYNEEKNIKPTVQKALKILEELKLENYEIILVDDGSKDRTGEIADELAKEHPHIKVIHQKNGGYGMALRAGFENAKFEWIVFTDSDGQFDFSEINKFLDKTESFDVIWGYRIKRNDPFFRLLAAKGWAVSLFLFFGLWLKDVDCAFRMYRKEVIEKVSPLISTRGGMINAELAIKIKKLGIEIEQVGVHHYPRKMGEATGVKFNVILKSYIDLLRLWWKLK